MLGLLRTWSLVGPAGWKAATRARERLQPGIDHIHAHEVRDAEKGYATGPQIYSAETVRGVTQAACPLSPPVLLPPRWAPLIFLFTCRNCTNFTAFLYYCCGNDLQAAFPPPQSFPLWLPDLEFWWWPGGISVHMRLSEWGQGAGRFGSLLSQGV